MRHLMGMNFLFFFAGVCIAVIMSVPENERKEGKAEVDSSLYESTINETDSESVKEYKRMRDKAVDKDIERSIEEKISKGN